MGLQRVRLLHRTRWPVYPVKTWCRVCGTPALIQIQGSYEMALRYAYRLDEAAMVHQNHQEAGGWGIHWRLDEVLHLIFPQDHVEDLWAPPPWYTNRAAEDQLVVIASDDDEYVDHRRRELIHEVNASPKSRREMEDLGQEVWGQSELSEDFEILGFRAPFVVVERRFDGARGSLMFQDAPRLYFQFEKERIL